MGKLILNIGHGGIRKDPGACANGFKEHDWNKDFVENYIVPECEEQGVEYTIVNQEYFSTLHHKINAVAKTGDITLSFHLNAAEETATGVEMLYWNTSKKSLLLADYLQNANLQATKLRNRGIRPRVKGNRGWTLLYYTKTPCVILETGFITNADDMQKLEEVKSELAKVYVEAAKKYLEENIILGE